MSEKPMRQVSEEEAREVAEASRETQWTKPSFMREMFLGNFRLDLVHPYPEVESTSTDFEAFYRAICELLDTLEVPRTLSEIGVPEGCAAQIAEKAMQDAAAGTNPRPVTIEDIEEVTRTALQVGR